MPTNDFVVSKEQLAQVSVSNWDTPVEITNGVECVRVDPSDAEVETYYIGHPGGYDYAVAVTRSANQWITFGPNDRETGGLPDNNNGRPHVDLPTAVNWAVNAFSRNWTAVRVPGAAPRQRRRAAALTFAPQQIPRTARPASTR